MVKWYQIFFLIFLLTISISNQANSQILVEPAYPGLSFSQPIDFQIANGIDDTVFVAERAGRILKFKNDFEVSATIEILDIRSNVSTSGEGGLLGFAFHPDFESNPYIFVHYTPPDPFRSVFSRFTVDLETGIADESTEFILFELDQPFSNHNAGQLRFGPDGFLYIATGDGGSGGDPLGNGQDRTTLHGNILRIDVDQTDPGLNYSIPADNPFVDNEEGWREEIFAWGLRNPFRFSFDSQTDELWVGDVGQNRREEVNIVESGKNYGWNTMEGSLCFSPETGCDQTGLELPVFEYGLPGSQAITGGFVYRGNSIPELFGRYVYADFSSGDIWSFAYDGNSAFDNQPIDNLGGNRIVCFGEDQNRELHICSFDGNIYRINTSVASSIEEESLIPENIRLSQNYPNPFNPNTVISFTLPESAEVTLEIYNIVGQKIETLVSRRLSAGEHSVNFNASNLSSGIYVYVLRTDSRTLTRTMTLLK
ncbi:MAG: PQQ-dependent sugar dehydrogenase [Balneolaceae bacterium]